ncbi:hypothetical protein B296_00002386 [Ensete ventricosum]|uniref:Uncharacterized protein n=1 Tax=Ensete ventricosum TaxID=4639 RepID=A0A427AFZ0_ENSVE|nr:hypothetical protein B296_00002386 [Ensete ventricosum]
MFFMMRRQRKDAGALGRGGCNNGRDGATAAMLVAERLKQRRKREMAVAARLCGSRCWRQQKQQRHYRVLVKWKEETQLWVRCSRIVDSIISDTYLLLERETCTDEERVPSEYRMSERVTTDDP